MTRKPKLRGLHVPRLFIWLIGVAIMLLPIVAVIGWAFRRRG